MEQNKNRVALYIVVIAFLFLQILFYYLFTQHWK